MPISKKPLIRSGLGGGGTLTDLSSRPSIVRECSRTCLFSGVKPRPGIHGEISYLQFKTYCTLSIGFERSPPTLAIVFRSSKGLQRCCGKMAQHGPHFAQLSVVVFDHLLKYPCHVLKSTSNMCVLEGVRGQKSRTGLEHAPRQDTYSSSESRVPQIITAPPVFYSFPAKGNELVTVRETTAQAPTFRCGRGCSSGLELDGASQAGDWGRGVGVCAMPIT